MNEIVRMSKGRKYSLGLTLWLATTWKRFLLVSQYFVRRLFITNPAVIYPQEIVTDLSWICVATGECQITLSCRSNLPGRTERIQSRPVSCRCRDPREHRSIYHWTCAYNIGKKHWGSGGPRVSPLGNCWKFKFKIWSGDLSPSLDCFGNFFVWK